eukprot:COSAG01_NODE_202_length_22130_cov_167.927239_8_plen_296_part_00
MTEIYLCGVCSGQEILRRSGRGQAAESSGGEEVASAEEMVGAALAAYDRWQAAHTCTTVAAQSEAAVASVLASVNSVLKPPPASGAPPSARPPGQSSSSSSTTRTTLAPAGIPGELEALDELNRAEESAESDLELGRLPPALALADRALSAEESYWGTRDHLRSLPLAALARAVRKLCEGFGQHIQHTEELFELGRTVERRCGQLGVWEAHEPGRGGGEGLPDVAALAEHANRARACAAELEAATVELGGAEVAAAAAHGGGSEAALAQLEQRVETLRRGRYHLRVISIRTGILN